MGSGLPRNKSLASFALLGLPLTRDRGMHRDLLQYTSPKIFAGMRWPSPLESPITWRSWHFTPLRSSAARTRSCSCWRSMEASATARAPGTLSCTRRVWTAGALSPPSRCWGMLCCGPSSAKRRWIFAKWPSGMHWIRLS